MIGILCEKSKKGIYSRRLSYHIYKGKGIEKSKIMQSGKSLVFSEEGKECKAFYTTSDFMKDRIHFLINKEWLFIDATNMQKQNGNPIVFTLYAVRGAKGYWNVLPLPMLNQTLNKATLEIVKCISGFIPSLAYCTIKFVLDGNRSPLLVNFTGWDSSMFVKKQKSNLLNAFKKHYLDYNNLLLNQKLEKNHVD